MATEQLGWIGLGSMGLGMAKNLQNYLAKTSASALIYTNRTLSRGESLEALGAKPVKTVAEVAKDSTIIFSCLSNDQVLTSTAAEMIRTGSLSGKIYVDCSTVHPDTSTAVARDIAAAGGSFIAAPVFGASAMAEAGKLIFVTAGPASATARIASYLVGVMGTAIIPMGEDVSKSSLLKIAGNICVVSFMEVISEAQVFAEKTGLGTDVLENMLGTMFGPVIESYSKRLTTGAYAPAPDGKAGFDVALAIKDARHALSCAKAVGTSLNVSEVALAHMEAAQELGKGRPLDSSSMYGTIRRDAGLDFETELIKNRDRR